MPQALPMIAYYAAGGAAAGWTAVAAAVITSVAVSAYQASSAREKARAAAAAAQRDRNITIRSGVAPRRIVVGTVRLGGVLMHAEFVGDDQEYLDQVFALTHGEVGEFVGLYLDDEFVAAADVVDMVPQTGKYSGAGVQAQRVTWQGAAAEAATTVTIDDVPNDLDDVQAILEVGVGEAATQVPLTVASVVGTLVTFSAPLPSAGTVHVTYSTNANPNVPLRVQPMYGTEDQATTTWAGVSTPLWTADHRLRGVSGFRVLYRLDANVFAQGLPNPTGVIRGPKNVAGHRVWDPRTSSYINHTSNPALLAAWWRTLPRREGGCGVPFDWIDWPSVSAAANVCDELISVRKLDGSGYEDVKRYECNTVLSLDEQSPDENLRIILDAMAGEFPFAAGLYRCYAGAFRAATVTLTDDDVAGDDAISFAPMVGAEQTPPNVMTARIYSAAHNWVETGVSAVTNDAYITADGQEEPLELDLPASTDMRQANYLMGVRLEQLRPGMAGQITVLGRGADLMPMQTVQLDLDGYEALDGITFEIRKRTNHWSGRYTLELREVRASTYTLDADRFVPPTEVEPPDASELWNVTPVTITSVANAAIGSSGGSVVCRALVVWAEHPQRAVNPMGKIEVRYRVPDEEWTYANPVDGDREATYISPLREGDVLFIEARARNVVGAVSAWTGYPPFTVQAVNEVPQDVEGAGWEIKPLQVRIYWDRWLGEAPLEIELRVGSTWAGAELLWTGVATDYKHARPPNGTYRVWLAYRRGGVYSENPVSLDITVDDSIDQFGNGLLRLTTDRFPYFLFADGTTHTAQAPGADPITFTATLFGLKGTASFAAEAFDSDDDSLGAVTLGGSGNVRTMTAAQFVAPGTSGSVRYVDVTATLGSASDTLRVFRADPTITEARIYLSNPTHAVPTDANGENGDYSGASTEVQVFEGVTDVTDEWSIAITPDSGVTATINGGAGPVTGTLSVTVAVSDMTIPDGAVLVTASKTGEDDLTASFRVTKSESTGAYTSYWDPRSEIVLPVDAQGNVASYADAFSTLRILKGNADDSANWTFSKVDTNVTSTISTGGRVDVTALLALGELGTTTETTQTPWPSGWGSAHQIIYGGGVWLQIGYGSTSKIRRSTDDMATWQEVDTGLTAGTLRIGGYVGGVFVITGGSGLYIDRIIRSADGGLTWVDDTLPGSVQAYTLSRVGDELIIGGSTTAGYRTDDGDTWTSHTAPGNGCHFAGVGSAWASVDLSGVLRGSANGGSSWTTIDLAAVTGRTGLAALYARAFRGRLVAALYKTAGADPSMVVTSTNGLAWAACALPATYSQPDFLDVVAGVLYMVDSAGETFYSADGLTWGSSGDNVTSDISPPSAWENYVHIHDAWPGDFIPALELTTRSLVRAPLLATSASEGAVTVTATKPGEFDIVRTLIVRKGAVGQDIYTSYAAPAMLLLPATSDGVVTSYDNATITAYVLRNGVDDTANWSWTYTTTNLTPSSGTSNSITITAMGNSPNTGTISFRASKAGQQDITGTLAVNKVLGSEPSGPRIGAAFNAISFSHTEIGLRFKTDGRFQVRKGSGGSWADAGTWAGAVTSANSSYWLRVEASGHALDSGTTGTWLAMTSDRDYVLSDASSGTHTTSLQVMFATDSSGANAVLGFGSLQLIVP